MSERKSVKYRADLKDLKDIKHGDRIFVEQDGHEWMFVEDAPGSLNGGAIFLPDEEEAWPSRHPMPSSAE